MSDISRRSFLSTAGGALGAVWLAASTEDLIAAGHHAAASARQPAPAFKVLTTAQASALDALSAQIIPSEGTPPFGAREARVVHFMDHSLSTFAAGQKNDLARGLDDLRRRVQRAHGRTATFGTLTDAQQKAMIRTLEKDNAPLFHIVRGATISGMFANPEYGGNFRKQGWQLLGYQDRFSWSAPFGAYDR